MDAGKSHKCAADLGACGIAVSVQDAGQGMGALARAQIWAAPAITFAARYAIEIRAPFDEFRNPQRAFADERFGRGAIDQAVACVHRVFQVQCDVPVALHRYGNAALCVMRVRFAEGLFGDDENVAVAGKFNRGTKSGNARTHYQKVNRGGPGHQLSG